jgi:putative metalloprotease
MIKILLLFLAPLLLGTITSRNSIKRNNNRLHRESTNLAEPILKALTNRIAKSLGLDEIPISIHEVKTFNGLATSDGKIFLTRGALDAFYKGDVTAEELSSIVAHELGHVALGHSKRRMIDFSMQNALRIILSLTIGRLIPAIGTYIASYITSLVAAKLSRNDEYEADAYAAALLSKSGIGVDAQISLLKKLEFLVKDGGTRPQWLMSHPRTSERIMAIQELKRKWRPAT